MFRSSMLKNLWRFVKPPLLFFIRVLHWNEPQAGSLSTSSIVATCLEELPELNKKGVDEETIRGMGGTIHAGEWYFHMAAEGRDLTSLPWRIGAEETASKT